MRRRSLIEYLHHRTPDKDIAYIQRRGYRVSRWSYRRVAETSFQIARELEARGIGKGDAVLLWGENTAEWVTAFFGCLLRGAVAVPMDRIASVDFVVRVCHEAGVRLAICSQALSGVELPAPRITFESLLDLVSSHPASFYAVNSVNPDDVVEIIFTSGTTAEPKGVVLTHKNILANLEPLESEIEKYLKYERFVHPIRFLDLLPLSHVFGQFLGIWVPRLMSGCVAFLETLNPSEIIQTVRRERISVLVAVPRLLETLRDKIQRDLEGSGQGEIFKQHFEAASNEHFARRWWRFRRIHNQFGWKFWGFICGGAALDSETEQFWGRLSFVVIQGYGLTETTSLISVNHPFRLGKGSIGKILPGREIRLDKNGEILVRGESVAEGYWQGRRLKSVQRGDGWFSTGDMGELRDDGNLYFKGRKKNVIVTAEGMNIYPEDLEEALRRDPGVRDCVVVGMRKNGNEEPCAILILGHESADSSAVIQRVNRSLAQYQQIRRWQVWPDKDFPRTSTQKPRTNVILDRIQANREGRQASVGEGAISGIIERISGRRLGVLSPDANLAKDLNLSSVDRVELMSVLEDRYQIDLNETQFSNATTISDLEEMVRNPTFQKSEYHFPRWANHLLIRIIRAAVHYCLVRPATFLLAYPEITGCENIHNARGPLLVVSNHVTSVDIGFVLAALPARIRNRIAVAMEGERLQAMRRPAKTVRFGIRLVEKIKYALVVALFNVFPLPQRTGFRDSFSHIGSLVDSGCNILVFPEGQRTKDGEMTTFRRGIGLLVQNLGIPVIPVHIGGLFVLKQASKRWARPGSVRVTIGSARMYGSGEDSDSIARDLERCVSLLSQHTTS